MNIGVSKFYSLLLATIALFALSAPTSASLLGQTINFTITDGDDIQLFAGSPTVGAGVEFEDSFGGQDGFAIFLNVASEGFTFRFECNTDIADACDVGDWLLELTALSWGPGIDGKIVGATLGETSDIQGASLYPVGSIFNNGTAYSLAFTNTYVLASAGNYLLYDVAFEVEHPVPEPATYALMLLGFLLLGGWLYQQRRLQPIENQLAG